ncbi:MAG: PilW family protein [Candidatus Wenzhouxiangella sp. M2_3B_020]
MRSNQFNGNATGSLRAMGFSLIELMVAITLGLLLTAGMLQLFQGTKVTFNTNDALARVQENGRFTLELLKRQIREAGADGFCAADLEIENHLNQGCSGYVDALFDSNLAITGWDFAGTGSGDSYTVPDSLDPSGASAGSWTTTVGGGADLPDELVGEVVPGTDVIAIRRMEVVPNVTAAGNTPQGNAAINLNGSHGLPRNSLLLVTNCSNAADLFQNANAPNSTAFRRGRGSCSNPGPGNVTPGGRSWSTAYDDSMQVFLGRTFVYYVGADADGNPGLYQLELTQGTSGAGAQELVRGVENLQVQFGFSRAAPAGDGQSVDDWVDSTEVPADGWGQVLSVRLGISMRSPDFADLDDTAQAFDLAGVDVTTPGDGRLRQPFSSTIALRNRVLVF